MVSKLFAVSQLMTSGLAN